MEEVKWEKKGKKEKGQGGAEKGNCGGCQWVRLPDPGTTDSSRDIWLLKECIDHCPTSSMGHTINSCRAKHLLFPMFALWARSPARNLQIFSRLKTSGLGNFALSGIIYLDWWLNPGKMVILVIVCLSSSCFLPIIFTSTIPSLSNSKHELIYIVPNLPTGAFCPFHGEVIHQVPEIHEYLRHISGVELYVSRSRYKEH